jgi:hypothetical protein
LRKRKDLNQKNIEKELRRLNITFIDISNFGGGVGDILIGYHGVNYLFEIKNPDRSPSGLKLTKAEAEFNNTWQGQYKIVTNIYEILKTIKIREII